MSVVSFFILLLVLLLLPFLPSIIEIRRKLDAQPLRVTQSYDVDIHHFANRFREYIHTHFAQDLADSGTQAQSKQGNLEDGSHYCLLGSEAAVSLDEAERSAQVTNKLFVASAGLTLPGAMTYLNELYAADIIKGADENIYRALLAGADIELGRDSMLLRWMHAAGDISVPRGCVLYGRVSAGKRIVIATQSRFRRLHAKDILFGEHVPAAQQAQARQDINPED